MRRLPKLYQIGLRFPKTVLFISLVLTALAFWESRQLEVKSDLSALLPDTTPSVQDLKTMNRYFGGSSYLFVTVEAPERALAEGFADRLAARIETHPAVFFVESRRPLEYFKPRKWLYLDLEDLEEMERRIDRSLELEKEGVSAFFADFMNFTDPGTLPDLTFRDIIEKYKDRLDGDQKERTGSEDGRFIVLKVKAKTDAEDMDSSRRLLADIQELERGIKGEDPHYQGIAVGYTGGYASKIEQVDQITGEMAAVSLAVSGILMGLLLAYFRRVSAMAFVAIPLFISLIWTGGLTYLLLGHLNVVTGFGAAILAGLGSDYGIYLLSRYYQERELGHGFAIACDRAFAKTGRATHASMATTVGAFVALVFSSFGVFREFGIVGAVGVLSTYGAMMILMPSLLALWDKRLGKFRVEKFHPHFLSKLSWVTQAQASAARLFSRPVAIRGIAIALGLVLVSAFTLPEKTKIAFESGQMDDKDLPSNRLYSKVSEMIENSLSPTVLVVRGYEAAQKVTSHIETAIKKEPPMAESFKMVLGLSSFVPNFQVEKKALLHRIEKKFARLKLPKTEKRKTFLSSLRDAIAAPPVTRDDLPPSVSRSFISAHDPNVYAIYLFPAIDRTVAEHMRDYRGHIASFKDRIGIPFSVVDGNFITGDTVALMTREAPGGLLLLFVFLGGVLLAVIPSKKRGLLILIQLAGGLVLLSGLLWVGHIALNILNLAVISIILGTGIDSFIHFSHRYDETHDLIATVYSKTPAILVSNLSTMIGFGGLLFAGNTGLRSIGSVAIWGLAIVTLVAVLTFPQCLALSRSGNKS